MIIINVIMATLAALSIVFGTLKLSGVVAWSWWLVLIPFYPVAAWGTYILFMALMMWWVFKNGM